MRNNPWIRLASVWFFTAALTVMSILKITGFQKKGMAYDGQNDEQLAFEEVLKNENEKQAGNEGKIIVLKSSMGGISQQEISLLEVKEPEKERMKDQTEKTEESPTEVPPVTEGKAGPEEEKEAHVETEKILKATYEPETEPAIEPETEPATEPATIEPETEPETEKETEKEKEPEASGEKRMKEDIKESETLPQEADVTETLAAVPQERTDAATSYTCSFNCNINRSGRWNAGDEDHFTLEVYGTGTSETFSMEYFSYDTQKIDALYENYPELDPSHAAMLSEKFGNNRGVISYRCVNGDEVSYINILPDDGIIAVEGNEDAGMRFYTGESYSEEVLQNYEQSVSDGFTNGDEIVLQ